MDNFALFECEKERKKFVKNEYVREQCFHDCFTTIPDRLSFDDLSRGSLLRTPSVHTSEEEESSFPPHCTGSVIANTRKKKEKKNRNKNGEEIN